MIVDRAFRLAVQAFPREYRATRRDEIIDTFAEMSMSGGQVLIELWWVALAGLRMRFSPSSQVQQAILPSVCAGAAIWLGVMMVGLAWRMPELRRGHNGNWAAVLAHPWYSWGVTFVLIVLVLPTKWIKTRISFAAAVVFMLALDGVQISTSAGLPASLARSLVYESRYLGPILLAVVALRVSKRTLLFVPLVLMLLSLAFFGSYGSWGYGSALSSMVSSVRGLQYLPFFIVPAALAVPKLAALAWVPMVCLGIAMGVPYPTGGLVLVGIGLLLVPQFRRQGRQLRFMVR